jgi:hypothetical protein
MYRNYGDFLFQEHKVEYYFIDNLKIQHSIGYVNTHIYDRMDFFRPERFRIIYDHHYSGYLLKFGFLNKIQIVIIGYEDINRIMFNFDHRVYRDINLRIRYDYILNDYYNFNIISAAFFLKL